ncbi:unnamed protein product [Blepharisma stoltei]|uniref:Reverse transcriptase n=1 Tax=Blepharisma stoltei TaxID=1481888 RepID=A0AAU9J0I0_9CILI|nr:unnamed protein product [Blepharisma stoltei]
MVVQDWLNRYKLLLNIAKSNVVVYHSRDRPRIEINGERLQVINSYKYLGYLVDKRIGNTTHLKERLGKMKASVGTFMGMLHAMKGVRIEKKKTIARACINTVALYGTEVFATSENYNSVLEMMERLQRRYARRLLGAPMNACNETVLNDADIVSIETELDNRLLAFRCRLQTKGNAIIQDLLQINKQWLLPWEIRCRKVQEKYGLPDDGINDHWSKMKMRSDAKKIERMSTETWKTTGLYRTLIGSEPKDGLPLYLRGTPAMNGATSIIFGLRAGSNFTNQCRYTRHIIDSPDCKFCGKPVEDEVHVIEECEAYEESRIKITEFLKGLLKDDFSLLKLTEIVLYSWRLEQVMKKKCWREIEALNKNVNGFFKEILEETCISKIQIHQED